MSTLRNLPKEQWRGFFDRMSKPLLGKWAEIEVAALDLGDQIVAEWVPLIGITYDSKDDLLDVVFDAFYAEAGKLLAETVSARNSGLPMDIIDEAIRLNHALVHQPFARENVKIRLRYDLLDYWHKVRGGERALMREAPMAIEVDRTSKPYSDFQKWCREIVWWGNKKGAYLYSPRAAAITPELAGHY